MAVSSIVVDGARNRGRNCGRGAREMRSSGSRCARCAHGRDSVGGSRRSICTVDRVGMVKVMVVHRDGAIVGVRWKPNTTLDLVVMVVVLVVKRVATLMILVVLLS